MPRSHTTFTRAIVLGLATMLLATCARSGRERMWVKSISLEGSRQLPKKEPLRGLETKATPWHWWLPGSDRRWFDAGALDRDVARIETFYATNGYFRARVVDTDVRRNDKKRSVSVTLVVYEGKPTTTTSLEVQGLEPLPTNVREKVMKDLPLRTGQRFHHGRYLSSRKQIRQRLRSMGYAYAELEGEVRVDRDRHTARALFTVKPGPRVRFGATKVNGAGAIPVDKIERLVSYKRGEIYHPQELAQTRARIVKHQVFSSVQVKIPKEPTPEADVSIDVTTGKLRELRLGGGIGFERDRQEIRLRSQWIWRNFLGGLRRLEAHIDPAFVSIPTFWDRQRMGPTLESEISLTQPDAWATRISLFASLGYDVQVYPGYRYHGPTIQLGADRSFWEDRLRGGLSWNLELLHFFDVEEAGTTTGGGGSAVPFLVDPIAGLGLPDEGEVYHPAWLEPFIQLDLRDSAIDPRAGFWAELRLEQGIPALGSDFNYTKVVPEVRGYIPLGTKRVSLGLRALMGYMHSRDQDSPITRRLELGGPNLHRGFTFARLAPQIVDAETGTRIPIGGDGSLLFSGDLRLRLLKLADNWLGFTAFVDAGDVTVSFADIDPAWLHYAVGGSLDYQTPIGAIRMGIGVRINRVDNNDDHAEPSRRNPDPGKRIAFHLTMGAAF